MGLIHRVVIDFYVANLVGFAGVSSWLKPTPSLGSDFGSKRCCFLSRVWFCFYLFFSCRVVSQSDPASARSEVILLSLTRLLSWSCSGACLVTGCRVGAGKEHSLPYLHLLCGRIQRGSGCWLSFKLRSNTIHQRSFQ